MITNQIKSDVGLAKRKKRGRRRRNLVRTGRLPDGIALELLREALEEALEPVGLLVGGDQVLELVDKVDQQLVAAFQEETHADGDEEAVAHGLVLLDAVGQSFQVGQNRQQRLPALDQVRQVRLPAAIVDLQRAEQLGAADRVEEAHAAQRLVQLRHQRPVLFASDPFHFIQTVSRHTFINLKIITNIKCSRPIRAFH